MSALRHHRPLLTAGEYLRHERAAPFRSEYVNGTVFAMAGAREVHNVIATNLSGLMWSQLRQRPCKSFGADMKVRIEKANAFRYPDLSGLCGPILFHDSVQDAYCNPAFIIEVLSPSTELLDRGDKFALYRQLDSLCQYVLVHSERMKVEVFTKDAAGQWECVTYDEPEDSFELMGCTLLLADIYEKVTLP